LLRTPDGEKFYHPEGGPTYFRLDEYTVSKDHGHLDLEDDWDKIESLILENYANHHSPPSGLKESAGWMSPDGTFFPCRSWEHDFLAETLCRAEVGELESTRTLERYGWLRIYDNGLVAITFNGRRPATQKQIDALWDLHELAADKEYKENIRSRIRMEE
jgi:hypothetical protein